MFLIWNEVEVPQRFWKPTDWYWMILLRKFNVIEPPSGGIKTNQGEVLIRAADRKRSVEEFQNIIIRSSYTGATLRLGDIATITDGYTDSDEESFYNGDPAVRLVVYSIRDQTPTEVAASVKKYKEVLQGQLPECQSFGLE